MQFLTFIGWGVFLVVANAAGKFILFTVTNHASDELGTDEVNDLKGLFVNNKIVGLAFTVASLSAIGLPVFLGFVVKMNILGDLFAELNYGIKNMTYQLFNMILSLNMLL